MLKVAVTMAATIEDAGEFIADIRALEAAGAEMIGVDGDPPEQWILMAAIAAATERIRLRTTGSEPDSLRRLCRDRGVASMPAGETWVEVPMPADRDSWTEMLRDQESAGATGVVVPWDPRLIDLLRNADPDDRSDLMMSTG